MKDHIQQEKDEIEAIKDEIDREREMIKELRDKEMALDEEDREYVKLKEAVKTTFDNCIEDLRNDSSPRKPCFHNKENYVHLSYMNMIAHNELEITNCKFQDRVIRQEMTELLKYKRRLDKANNLEMLFRREVLEFLYTIAYPRI